MLLALTQGRDAAHLTRAETCSYVVPCLWLLLAKSKWTVRVLRRYSILSLSSQDYSGQYETQSSYPVFRMQTATTDSETTVCMYSGSDKPFNAMLNLMPSKTGGME